MTPDEKGFLAVIAADPDDDTPRLAYPAFREGRGDPSTAEFFRLQVGWPRGESSVADLVA